MAYKIHLRGTVGGLAVCAARFDGRGKARRNNRSTYSTIPANHQVSPDDFRATQAAERCAHCADLFQDTLNRRRRILGLPLYANAWTKELEEAR